MAWIFFFFSLCLIQGRIKLYSLLQKKIKEIYNLLFRNPNYLWITQKVGLFSSKALYQRLSSWVGSRAARPCPRADARPGAGRRALHRGARVHVQPVRHRRAGAAASKTGRSSPGPWTTPARPASTASRTGAPTRGRCCRPGAPGSCAG